MARTLRQVAAAGLLTLAVYLAPVLALWGVLTWGPPPELPIGVEDGSLDFRPVALQARSQDGPPSEPGEADRGDDAAPDGSSAGLPPQQVERGEPAPTPATTAAVPRPGRKAGAKRRRNRRQRDLDGVRITRAEPRRRKGRIRKADFEDCSDYLAHIVQIDSTHYLLPRGVVHCYASHYKQWKRVGTAFWHDDDRGRRVGARLRVRRGKHGDMGRAAGMKDGDVVHAVGGIPLTTWPTVGVAATLLMARGRLRVKVERDGEVRVVHYRIATRAAVDRKVERLRRRGKAPIRGTERRVARRR